MAMFNWTEVVHTRMHCSKVHRGKHHWNRLHGACKRLHRRRAAERHGGHHWLIAAAGRHREDRRWTGMFSTLRAACLALRVACFLACFSSFSC